MKVSELDEDTIANYVNISSDDDLIDSLKSAAIEYACSYTGLSESDLDDHEDITIAVLALISSMYDQRAITFDGVGTNVKLNPTVETILGMHSVNLLPVETEDEE